MRNVLIDEGGDKTYVDDNHVFWYSANFVQKQIQLAYQNGLANAAHVVFHAIQPQNDEMVGEFIEEFNRRVRMIYNQSLLEGKVVRQG